MHERHFRVLKYALQVAFFQTQTFLHLIIIFRIHVVANGFKVRMANMSESGK